LKESEIILDEPLAPVGESVIAMSSDSCTVVAIDLDSESVVNSESDTLRTILIVLESVMVSESDSCTVVELDVIELTDVEADRESNAPIESDSNTGCRA
jgi:hypothetical protein